MNITAIKTPIVKEGDDLTKIIANSLKHIPERSVLVIASKIISYSQHRLIPIVTGDRQEKLDLAMQEADRYLPSSMSQYDLILTVKNHHLTVNAGIDESNANGKYVLWPNNLQAEANKIWQFVRRHYQVNQVGVIVTDSRTWPLRWGVVGTCLAHCGFKQLYDYREQEDLFGRPIHFVQLNVAEAIASMAALEMGEVAEQTPLGLVENIRQIEFQEREPTQEELDFLKIELEDDMYGPLLKSAPWKKGGGGIDLKNLP
ncbi:MAG: DNA polymerase III beta clamp subunit [Microgenomates bacterium 39_7]|nr:MAG: DNA polymerase III beta clamp subunit [Microgenomates bacterium 39_7]